MKMAEMKRLRKCAAVIGLLSAAAIVAVGCSSSPSRLGDSAMVMSPTRAVELPPAPGPLDPGFVEVSKIIERPGRLHDSVYTIAIPRDDLEVHIEGMLVPTAAGIESVFNFYRCPCGKLNIAGQFVVADYEANDVIDALRKDPTIKIASMGPLLIHENPRLILIRFQAEGKETPIASAIREALRWTGRERMAGDPAPKASK